MAIPFYENEEQEILHQQPLQQQQSSYSSEEVDQVDGHIINSPPIVNSLETPPSSPAPSPNPTEGDVVAWKLLALAMCKALKDHYQQNMVPSSSNSSSTAVIQILPNGQVKPSWN
ncbi:sickle [Musca autumnalis]|uniref:sickle n=1 Tax=Musca autumnalis TaxID=221902 RepID=UPI003CF05937